MIKVRDLGQKREQDIRKGTETWGGESALLYGFPLSRVYSVRLCEYNPDAMIITDLQFRQFWITIKSRKKGFIV